VCAPYFVNLNNKIFQLKTLLFFVHLRSQQKRTEKVISSYLFELFRALVRSVEWSGVSGVDSPGSVPGPPQQCAAVHYRVLVQWTPLFAIASDSQYHACSISCLCSMLFWLNRGNRYSWIHKNVIASQWQLLTGRFGRHDKLFCPTDVLPSSAVVCSANTPREARCT